MSSRPELMNTVHDVSRAPSRLSMRPSMPPERFDGDPSNLPPGAVVKHYEVIRKLGAGGMGTVYLARDTRLGRLVAMKFLLESSGTAIQRFLVEARTTAQCRHDNIVIIYDVDEINDCPYMILEYIEGSTLRRAIASGTRDTTAVAIELMLPVARALACAHAMGIIHRDLKPDNILLSDSGQVKVLDFGIAKQVTLEEVKSIAIERAFSMTSVGLTQEGELVGTMPYMSPEQWLGEPLDGRSDLWAVGLILFEIATGNHPLDPMTSEDLFGVADLDLPMPSARLKIPGAPALADIIDRCLKKRKEERFASAAELADALEKLGAHQQTKVLSEDESPFAGLSAFQEADADRFFGRDDDIAAVAGRLRHQQLVTIAGASGAGKSSFVRAGIIPALKRAGREVETFIVRPGRRPLAALADVLAFFLDTSGIVAESDSSAIAEMLRTRPGYLGSKLRTRCRRRGAGHRILLVVDQFEELYTQGIDPAERAAFCASIEGVADEASSPLRVIVTIRADFLDRVSEDRRFLAAMTRGLVFLPPLTNEGLGDALRKPLERMGYRFEDDGLCDEMIAGLAGTKSPLPLLQFTATKLWEMRDREAKCLTRTAYRALGGVAGTLSTHADTVLSGMSLSEQQMARSIFLRLVTPERTRAVARWDELTALSDDVSSVEQVVQLLAEARLLSIEAGGEGEGKTVELTHESLIDRWGKLRQWLDDNEKDAAFLAELRNAAGHWEKNGQAEGFLWRDRAATEAAIWFERRRADLGADKSIGISKREIAYLEAVVRLEQRTKRRRRQWVGGLFAAISAVAVTVSALAIDARAQARRADEQAKRADEQAGRADIEAKQAQEEARQARNATRIAAARGLEGKDPTMVLALLREIEPGSVPSGWSTLAMWVKGTRVSEAILRHDAKVYASSWSPDAKRIVTISDKVVRVWNADGVAKPLALEGHEDRVFAASFSPDGKSIASASADDTVRVWNAEGTGQPVVLRGHTADVWSVAWSPDGRRIVSMSVDKTVRVWNANGTGEPIVLTGHTSTIGSALFSPDGHYVATASWDKTVRIWKVDEPGSVIVLDGHKDKVLSAAFSPDGLKVVSASADATVRVWNADGSGKPLVLEHGGGVALAAFSPDGQHILTSVCKDQKVRVWNADGSGQPVAFEVRGTMNVPAAFSPDGKYVVGISNDNIVSMWNADGTGEQRTFKGHEAGASVYRASFSPDGERIASVSSDKTVRIWKTSGKGITKILQGHSEWVTSAAFSPDGQRIVSGSRDKTVRVWNADGSGKPLILSGHGDWVTSAAFSPDGQKIVSAARDNTVRVWNADGTGQPLIFDKHKDRVLSAFFSHDGRSIVSASADKTVRVWNADGTGTPVVLEGHANWVAFAAFSEDAKRVVSTSWDNTARIWNADGQGQPIVIQGGGFVTSAAFTPDGRRLAFNVEETVRLIDADGKGEPLVLRGHESLAAVGHDKPFTPDGQHFVSSSMDGTIRIWSTDGKGEPLVLRVSDEGVNSASFSPDGKRIVTSSDDKTVMVFEDLEPLRNADDVRLWRASAHCIPMDVRLRLLGFGEEQSLEDLRRCEKRVADVWSGHERN